MALANGSYRGVPVEQRRAERRARLLDAGREAFGTLGFHRATVKGVCQAAGLTERYFYQAFDNLEALLIAVYNERTVALRDTLIEAFSGGSPARSEAEIVDAAATAFFRWAEDPRAVRICYREMPTATAKAQAIYARTMNGYVDTVLSFGPLFETLESVEPERLRVLAEAGVGGFVHTAMAWERDGYAIGAEVLVAALRTMVLGTMQTLRAEGPAR